MKGMVFVELIDMAEAVLGEAVVDEILDSADLDSGGAFTAVGNYPCSELVTLVGALSDRTGLPIYDLQRKFGDWMHARFVKLYPAFFTGRTCPLEMLEAIEGEVHVEVRKLYPEAELPRFDCRRPSSDSLIMVYRSPRPLTGFCHGLIDATVAHFGRKAEVTHRSLGLADDGVAAEEFTVQLVG